jgi:hypothetical protein
MRPVERFSVPALGERCGHAGTVARRGEKHLPTSSGAIRRNSTAGATFAAAIQNPEYRHADPRDVVEVDRVAMSGLAGAP